jgi:arabinose-5-phosphate isomerase
MNILLQGHVSLQVLHIGSEAGDEVSVVEAARDALKTQAGALERVADQLGIEFSHALDLICRCDGRVVVCGVGKSGLIGRKIAATFACSGVPSLFLHAADAAHGDLGMVTRNDLLLLISHSGATEELVNLLPHFEELGVPIISLVGQTSSPLALAADVAVCTQVEREACPHNVLVTTSALVTLAVADALALAVMNRRNVSAGDLGRRHPRGALGKRFSNRVRDVMSRESLPLVPPELPVGEALVTMASSRCGLLIVVDAVGAPLGIVTPDELRDAVRADTKLLARPVSSIMSSDPVTVTEDASHHAAEEKMLRLRLSALVVVDAKQRVSGVVQASAAR